MQSLESESLKAGSVTRRSSFIDFIPGKKKISVNLLIVIVGIIYIIAKIIIQSDRANHL